MGGHVGGEVAARLAVETLRQAFDQQPTARGLREAVGEANLAVWGEGQVQADLRGMGTTLTAAALVHGPDGRDVMALANVGDSRAYVFSAGQLTQVTADHSLAEEKVRHGRADRGRRRRCTPTATSSPGPSGSAPTWTSTCGSSHLEDRGPAPAVQ